MFPPAGAQIYYNEAGEPLGWDAPTDSDTFYCDRHGFAHTGDCEELDAQGAEDE